MNATISAVFVAASVFLQGCGTHAPEQLTRIPPPEVSRALPLEVPTPGHPDMPLARVCKLGASCMELDPRPFEACLVGTRHCVDKAAELVEVTAPDAGSGSGVVETRAKRGG
jgi:hypothetical protein